MKEKPQNISVTISIYNDIRIKGPIIKIECVKYLEVVGTEDNCNLN